MSNTGIKKTTMRAWAINAYGGPEQMRLVELPVPPEPGPRDMLMRMHGAEVGDWDALVREGEWLMERPFQLVLGLAGAGTKTESMAQRDGGGPSHRRARRTAREAALELDGNMTGGALLIAAP